jgi:rubrerythrin
MDHLEEALRVAMRTEKRSLDFYEQAAMLASTPRIRGIFCLLASEETKHLQEFRTLFTNLGYCKVDEMPEQWPILDSRQYHNLLQSVRETNQESKSLEIALREEEACIELYTTFAKSLNEPTLKCLFESALKETHQHRDIIQEEYMRIMGMVDRSEENIYVRE